VDHLPVAQPIRAVPPVRHRAVAANPDSVRPARTESSTVTMQRPADSAATEVATAAPGALPADTSPPRPDSVAPVIPQPRDVQPRWVMNSFVNLRAWPAENSNIVGVLKPGQLVYAGEVRPDGWQPIYLDGKRVGFVARALLRNLPPR
jgi:hypothetical protein